jgi:hypothetical protein
MEWTEEAERVNVVAHSMSITPISQFPSVLKVLLLQEDIYRVLFKRSPQTL